MVAGNAGEGAEVGIMRAEGSNDSGKKTPLHRREVVDAIKAIQQGIKSAKAGKGHPVGEFLKDMRSRFRIPT